MELGLPDELIVEILVRLPNKDVARCKCVSKTWNHYLSDLDCRRHYLRRLNADLLGVFQFQVYSATESNDGAANQGGTEREQLGKISFLPTSYREGLFISKHDFMAKLGFFLGSSGGLVLCGFHPMTYFVCNPVTNKWISLPQPSTLPAADVVWIAVGIYCKENNYTVVRADVGGYIYDPERRITKVGSNTIHIETYSSETAAWSAATVKGAYCFSLFCELPCTSIKGTFFWTVNGGGFVAYDPTVATDQLWVIESPSFGHLIYANLGESADGLIQCVNDWSWSEFSIHVLQKELRSYSYSKRLMASEWVLRHSVRFDIPGMVWFKGSPWGWFKRSPWGPSPCDYWEGYKNHPRRLAFHPRNPLILYLRVGKKLFCLDFDTGLVEDVPYRGNLTGRVHFVPRARGRNYPPCVVDYNLLPYFLSPRL